MLIRLLLCLLLVLSITSLASALTTDSQEDICATAAVVMCDNFEARAVDQGDMTTHYYKNNGWAVSCVSAQCPRITSTAEGVYSGSRSLQLTYPSGNNTGGGFLDSAFPSTNRTLYMRWWQKHSSNFKWSYIATKNMEWIASNGVSSFHAGLFGSGGGTGPKQADFYNSYSTNGSPWKPAANLNGDVYVTAGVWYCMETRYTINTTQTSTDGYLQGWVNGVQHWEYPNVNLNNQAGAQGPITGTLISSYWNCYSGGSGSESCTDPSLDNHPLMYRWIDNLVVSTQRIGCENAIPPDTIAPTAVTNATATAASQSSIVLTHDASTDAVGVSGYDYYRCTGAACTNFAVVSTNNALSYADTGLTASTLYRYKITAKDAAGNISVASSIVEATTAAAGSTTRRQLLSDTITRADSVDLGTGFDAGYTGQSAMKVVSNAIQGSTLSATHLESDNTVTWPADQWAQVQLVTYTNGLSGGGPACRMANPATANGYTVDTNVSNNYVIRKIAAGVYSTIATSTVAAVSNGFLRLECVGSTQTLYLNDVAIAAAADATYATGRAGLMLYVATSLSNTVFDNFVAGDYTASTMPTITAATADATGASLTFGSTTPTSVRVQVSGNTPSDTVATTATTAGGKIGVGSDTFTRANNADLGTNWTPINNTWALATNAAQASAVNAAMVELETTALQNNQYAQATISAIGGSVDIYGGVKTRATDVGDTGYMCLAARGTSAGTSLERRNVGVATYLATESASVWTASDIIRLESDGITHRCYKNGVKILEATDSNLTTGFAGIWGYIAVGGTATDLRLDSFVSGNLTPLDTTGRYTYTWPQGSTSVTFMPRDSTGVENRASGATQTVSLTSVVSTDTTPPVISGGSPTSVLAAGTTSITESVMTDERARCKRSLTDQDFSLMSGEMGTANGFTHTWSATGLSNNTSYTVYVRCTDQYDVLVPYPANINPTSYSFTYSVAAAGGDTTAPSTVAGVSATAVSAAQINVTFTAATDNTAVIGYEGHLCVDASCTTSQLINPTWSTATSQSIVGLSASTQYYIAVRAFDAAGNRSAAFSNVVPVTTLAAFDVTPPSTMTGLRPEGTYKNSVVLTWDAGTDDRGVVTTMIEQSPAGCAAFSQVVSQLAVSKLVVSLSPNTTYCFRGKFADSSGNLSTAWSDTLQVTTGATGLPQPRLTILIPRTTRN